MKHLVRAAFIIFPAGIIGLIGSFIDPALGVIFAAGVIGLCIAVTEPRPERGELK